MAEVLDQRVEVEPARDGTDPWRIVETTTIKAQVLEGRGDLLELLRVHFHVILPGTLIVADEYSDWQNRSRRADLLGIDKDANLVVIELQRTECDGHVELQAIRNAAMFSTLTFDRLVTIYLRYLIPFGEETNAKERLLQHLKWDDPGGKELGKDVKIVLVATGFSSELATAVRWLNERGLDIRCIRVRPYENDGQTLLDAQTVIPISEGAGYSGGLAKASAMKGHSRSLQ